MQYFSNAFFKFFDELTKNNNKEWFDKHKQICEKEVKAPFKKLVTDVSLQLHKDNPEINTDANKAIFRLFRDIRFSKDKSPYKNYVSAIFSRTGTKDKGYAGFYLHIGADEIMVGGGKYFCEKEEVQRIRQEILYNPGTFKKLLEDKAFKEKFGTLKGEQSKIAPPEIKEFAAQQPLIMNKQFWYFANLKRSDVTGKDFDKLILSYFKAAHKMNAWLWETVQP